MTFGLANSAKKARLYAFTTNQNQGGGDKKGGFPFSVGRNHWDSIFITPRPLAVYNTTIFPLASQSRPVGSWTNGNTYWHIPGTGNQ